MADMKDVAVRLQLLHSRPDIEEEVSEKPGDKVKGEEDFLEREQRKEYLKDRKQDRRERIKYAGIIKRLVRCWLIAIIVIVVLSGIGNGLGFETLSDSVILALLGTATVNVIGLFYVVAGYLFPKRKRN